MLFFFEFMYAMLPQKHKAELAQIKAEMAQTKTIKDPVERESVENELKRRAEAAQKAMLPAPVLYPVKRDAIRSCKPVGLWNLHQANAPTESSYGERFAMDEYDENENNMDDNNDGNAMWADEDMYGSEDEGWGRSSALKNQTTGLPEFPYVCQVSVQGKWPRCDDVYEFQHAFGALPPKIGLAVTKMIFQSCGDDHNQLSLGLIRGLQYNKLLAKVSDVAVCLCCVIKHIPMHVF